MKTIIYLLQVTACTGIFYGFYFLLLRRLTFFTLNRWYLLATLLLSFVIPAISIHVDTAQPPAIIRPVMYVNRIQVKDEPIKTVAQATPQQEIKKVFDWATPVKAVYIAMAAISVVHLMFTLFVFFRRSRAGQLMQIGNVKILKGDSKQGNSSFLNVIFVNDDELEPAEVTQIIAHEMLHVKMLHSADRIIARLAQIVLWFNPFAYCYIRSIEENHEFEVDRIIAGDADKSMYATLLFKLSITSQSYLMHSFSKVPLKSRIAMLFNKPTSNMKKIVYLLIAPVVLISCLAFANLKSEQDKKVSIFPDLDKMGPHPLVLINGKEYNDDILYKISGKNINTTGTAVPPVTGRWFKTYGDKVKDGVVNISVKGQIAYLTATERENLIEESKVPKKQFFARVKQKYDDGRIYEKCIVQFPNGSRLSSNELKPTDKVVFIIEGKAYPESELNKVEEFIRSHKIGTSSVGSVNPDHKVYFNFLLDRNEKPEKTDLKGAVQKVLKEDTTIGINKYRQIDRLRGKRNPYPVMAESPEYIKNRKVAERVGNNVNTYKVTGFVDTGRVKGYAMTNEGDAFILSTLYGPKNQLDGKLKAGDEIQVKGMAISVNKAVPVIIMAESITKNGALVYKINPEDQKDKTAFLFEGNRVRYMYGKIIDIQKYPNGKWKSAVVLKENGYKVKFYAKPTAPSFAGIKEGDNVTFRFVHEYKTGTMQYDVKDWVALSNNIKDYGIKNPDFFNKFYEKI